MIDPTTKNAYAKRVGSLCSDSNVLTSSVLSDINQVFYGEGPAGDLSATNLSIRYVTGQEYHNLVTGTGTLGQFEPKTLYVISSDEINAYNTQIKNVASPNDDYDATNRLWVEQSIASAVSCKIDSSEIAPQWEAKHYNNGDIVSFDGKLYIMIDNDYIVQGQTPDKNNSAWAPTSISDVINQAIAALMQQIDELTLSVNALTSEVESLKNNQ